MTMRFLTQLHRKIADYESLVKETTNSKREWIIVEEVVTLSNSEFNYFINNLLEDYQFLQSEDKYLFLVTNGDDCLIVDTQGYSYPRYTGLIFDQREDI